VGVQTASLPWRPWRLHRGLQLYRSCGIFIATVAPRTSRRLSIQQCTEYSRNTAESRMIGSGARAEPRRAGAHATCSRRQPRRGAPHDVRWIAAPGPVAPLEAARAVCVCVRPHHSCATCDHNTARRRTQLSRSIVPSPGLSSHTGAVTISHSAEVLPTLTTSPRPCPPPT
jgi:hypothetical protein